MVDFLIRTSYSSCSGSATMAVGCLRRARKLASALLLVKMISGFACCHAKMLRPLSVCMQLRLLHGACIAGNDMMLVHA